MRGRNPVSAKASLVLLATALLTGCAMPRAATSLHEVQNASAAGQIQLVPVTAVRSWYGRIDPSYTLLIPPA